MKKLLPLAGLLLLIHLYSCGFAYEERIIGKYYITGVETKNDLGLSYKLSSGDYVGKAPGRLLQYGFNDTFLVAKTQEYKKGSPSYYIIVMTKDAELAHEETFRVGPLTEEEYTQKWKQRLNIQLKDVKR
jgi:hypothetical protein